MKRSVAAVILVAVSLAQLSSASIPAKYDGFAYGEGAGGLTESIVIDAFFDPLCPDSRDAWPPLKKVIEDYSPHVSLIVHPFPLPYHDNSYIACRALHIADKLNASATYPLLELFFKHQDLLPKKERRERTKWENIYILSEGMFSNAPTSKKPRASIIDDMAKFGAMAVGNSFLPAFKYGFKDPKTDAAARVSFKYGCSRGVYGTPFFFVNGFALPDPGSAVDYKTWKDIIDPLVKKHGKRSEESVFYF